MRRIAMVLLVGLVLPPALAFTSPGSDLPSGWIRAGSHPGDYEMSLDPRGARSGKACAFIKGRGENPRGFGTLMQAIDATEYRSKRLRFSAQVRSAGIVNWAGLWMRIDGPTPSGSQTPATLGFDNMGNRPIKGTTDWKRYDVVLDVPVEAKAIAFGILLGGAGQAWIDDLHLEPVGADVPVTQMTGASPLPKKPNLTFER